MCGVSTAQARCEPPLSGLRESCLDRTREAPHTQNSYDRELRQAIIPTAELVWTRNEMLTLRMNVKVM